MIIVIKERNAVKIAVTAVGATLESEMDLRFGRAPYFILVDSDTLEFEAIDNGAAAAGGGAGIQAAQTMIDRRVEAVITGNMGPNAMQVLQSAGIPVYAGRFAVVKEVVEDFKNGKLSTLDVPNRPAHFGLKAGSR